jgi:hypothetical protein
VLQMFAFSHSALIVRHWFEVNLDDASMEHGARIELRELAVHPHRGSESAAQLVTADKPVWRADLFSRIDDEAGHFAAAHHHPYFTGNEPSPRAWSPLLQSDPWRWLTDQLNSLGAASGEAWPIEPADAADLPRYTAEVVAAAQRSGPDRCRSAAECFQLTQDAKETVRLMIQYLEQPELLNQCWVRPWTSDS